MQGEEDWVQIDLHTLQSTPIAQHSYMMGFLDDSTSASCHQCCVQRIGGIAEKRKRFEWFAE